MMAVGSNDRTPQRLLDDQIEPFLNQLQNAPLRPPFSHPTKSHVY